MIKRKRRKRKAVKAKREKVVYGKPYKPEFTEYKAPPPPYRRSGTTNIPSHGVTGVEAATSPPTYEGDMADREAKARQEAQRKRKMVAPMYNKGAYQFIGENPEQEILHGLGRKV